MSYRDTFTLFGDAEPEDSWHPLDPVAEQLTNLVRRTELLTRQRVRTGATDPHDVLAALADLVLRARRKRLYGRDLVRADQLDEDIVYVRSRL